MAGKLCCSAMIDWRFNYMNVNGARREGLCKFKNSIVAIVGILIDSPLRPCGERHRSHMKYFVAL